MDIAKDHELANSVKRPDADIANRKICQDCKQYIPKPEDKYPYWSTDTDALIFLGSGFPVYFTLLKRLGVYIFFMSLFNAEALIMQSMYLYAKLEDDDEVIHDKTSIFVKGTNYSAFKFRLVYGFDFGQWIKDNYVYLIILAQMLTLIFANYLTASLYFKDE